MAAATVGGQLSFSFSPPPRLGHSLGRANGSVPHSILNLEIISQRNVTNYPRAVHIANLKGKITDGRRQTANI